MKTLMFTALFMLASISGLAQTADQSPDNNQGANAPATRTDLNRGHGNWGWLGLIGLAGLGGLAGRNRQRDVYDRNRDVYDRNKDRDVSNIRRAG